MKQYMTQELADATLLENPPIEYPLADAIFAEHPGFDPILVAPDGIESKVRPSIAQTLHDIGPSPKRILDLGCGFAADGLYLASAGHHVTLVDDPTALEWQKTQAANLGLMGSISPTVGDARQIPSSVKFDVVIANMLLHFYDQTDVQKIVAGMRAVTVLHGLNILSVYNGDNPPQELLPPHNLKQLFPEGSLAKLYSGKEWKVVNETNGHASKSVPREFIRSDAVLIPSISELVVRRTALPPPPVNALIANFLIGGSSSTSVSIPVRKA